MKTDSQAAVRSADKNRHPWLKRSLLGLLLLLTLAAPALGGPPVGYTPTELPPLVADTESFARDINNGGQVVGTSVGAVTTAVRWERHGGSYGAPTILMPLPGQDSSFAQGNNNHGQVVGYSRSEQGPCVGFNAIDTAVVWDRHGMPTALRPLPGDPEARAFAINDRGEVIGTSLGPRGVGVPNPCESIFTPVRWDRDGNPIELPKVPLPGFGEGFGNDINNGGQAVGGSIDASFANIPFIVAQSWDANNVSTALPAPAGFFDAGANGINDNGVIVGETADLFFLPGDRAVVWDRQGNATTLPPLAGDPSSSGQAINNRGAVAGSSGTDLFGFFGPPVGTAVVWDKRGVPTALAPLPSDTDSFAFEINEPGDVVGRSRDAAGISTAVVWR